LFLEGGVQHMKFILLRIPKKTSLLEVKAMVNKKLSEKRTFPIIGKKPKLLSAKIVEHIDPQKIKEYYAVIEVDSVSTGRWLAKSCKSFKVCGKNCYFREYFERKSKSARSIENDKREGNSVTDKKEAQVKGVSGFARKGF